MADGAGSMRAWFQRRPLMLSLRCRAAYDLREKGDFRKLATLRQTGRSTATTLLAIAAIIGLRTAGDRVCGELEERGFAIVVVRPGRPVEEQIAAHAAVFGKRLA